MKRHIEVVLWAAAVALLYFVSCASVSASDHSAVEADLNRQFNSKPLTFRKPCRAGNLIFGVSGQLVGSAEPGTWANDGSFRVNKVHVESESVRIEGTPLTMYYDENARNKFASRRAKIHVTLQLGGPPDAATIQAAFNRVFWTSTDNVPYPPVPTFEHLSGGYETESALGTGAKYGGLYRLKGTSQWQQPKDIQQRIEAGEWENGATVYVVTGPITAPKALQAPDPQFPKEESRAMRSGGVVLDVLIDPEGKVGAIRIEKATSDAFAAASAAEVSAWRFKPATLNDTPVAVLISVQTNFRLF
jgi:TonB family protein